VRYSEDDYAGIVRPEYDVEREPTEDRPAEIGVENLEAAGRRGNVIDQPVQFIQESSRGANAPRGVPSGSFIGVP
jgi:hypothetical protein